MYQKLEPQKEQLLKLRSRETKAEAIRTNALYVVNLWEVVHMEERNAKTRKKLKQISSVKDFESLIEQTMLSDEEKRILWLHYKEQKTMSYIADELGMSEITVKKKHSKMLMKIGKMF